VSSEVAWFSALCDDDYEFLGVADPALRSSWEHCRDIALAAESGGYDNLLLPVVGVRDGHRLGGVRRRSSLRPAGQPLATFASVARLGIAGRFGSGEPADAFGGGIVDDTRFVSLR
jgi:hypothetical protein